MVHTFIKALEQHEYNLNASTIEELTYNNISYAESREYYSKQLRDLFADFKDSLLGLTPQQLKAILGELKTLNEQETDIPNYDEIELLREENERLHLKSISYDIKCRLFIREMYDCQRSYIHNAISYIEELLPIDNHSQKQPTTQEKSFQKEWLTLDEVTEKYNLPKNNIKSRKWREEHGFPSGNAEPYGKLNFSTTAVEKWLSERKC